jgi:nitrite reductase/ring-hydroxylating ferredoxin subunit
MAVSWLTDRLAVLMRERELTVDALARQLAVERSRLTAIISGTALPNDNLIRRLARALGEDPDKWLAATSPPPIPPPSRGRASAGDSKPPEAAPVGFVTVAAVGEIADGEMKIVCDGAAVVANAAGRLYAFGNICPHAQGPLGEGFLDGLTVECPWHNGQWDIASGKGLTALATADIPVFEVRVVGEDIEIRLTGATPAGGEGPR